MANIHFQTPTKELTLITSTPLPDDDESFTRLNELMNELYAAVPIASLSMVETSAPPQQKFAYEIVSKDSRNWAQVIAFPQGQGEAEMTFLVPEFWKESEFRHQRELRFLLISLVNDYGMTSLTCSFT